MVLGNMIALYHGSASNIPKGWKLCDGNNGTPNLKDKFVKGAANEADIGQQYNGLHSHNIESGGIHSHGSTATGGNHSHGVSGDETTNGFLLSTGTNRQYRASRGHDHPTVSSTSHNHTAGDGIVAVKWYKLCYIMGDMHYWNFPVGSIVMWTGSIFELPRGWRFCDGTNGTIDLRDRFVKGASTKGIAGGTQSHSHGLASGGEHTHTTNSISYPHQHHHDKEMDDRRASTGKFLTTVDGPAHTHNLSSAGSHTHNVLPASNDPPYYKLAFIQRIA